MRKQVRSEPNLQSLIQGFLFYNFKIIIASYPDLTVNDITLSIIIPIEEHCITNGQEGSVSAESNDFKTFSTLQVPHCRPELEDCEVTGAEATK